MNNCHVCKHPIIIYFTETTFGHGDSTHKCYGKCAKCGNTSTPVTNWGIFEIKTFREAQDNWNKENP